MHTLFFAVIQKSSKKDTLWGANLTSCWWRNARLWQCRYGSATLIAETSKRVGWTWCKAVRAPTMIYILYCCWNLLSRKEDGDCWGMYCGWMMLDCRNKSWIETQILQSKEHEEREKTWLTP